MLALEFDKKYQKKAEENIDRKIVNIKMKTIIRILKMIKIIIEFRKNQLIIRFLSNFWYLFTLELIYLWKNIL